MPERSTFLTSDSHFLHYNILGYCDRPFTDEYDMNRFMVERWNLVVKPTDIVWHLGDIVCGVKGRDEEAATLLESLNGEIHLIRGNHDHYPNEYYLAHNIKEVVEGYKIIDGVLLSHYPLFDDKYDKERMRINKAELAFAYNKHRCWFHLYGHSHNHASQVQNALNMSVELWEYTPVKAIDILPHNRHFKRYLWQKPIR